MTKVKAVLLYVFELKVYSLPSVAMILNLSTTDPAGKMTLGCEGLSWASQGI